MPADSTTCFGALLRAHRIAAGLTQEILAERAGLSVYGIQKLERGTTHPYRDTAERLLKALQLAPVDAARFRATVEPVRRHGSMPRDVPVTEARHNLPLPLTSFVGRQTEKAEIARLLRTTRLVTLTGVGGCGKTRLALEVARELIAGYSDGVWLVELAPLEDDALVAQTVAAVFDMRELADQPIATALASTLRRRSLLLVLDNCEHLLDGCARLVDAMLRSCPELRILATSREVLGITGETTWRVPSLPLLDPRRRLPLIELERNPAICLFVERARAVQTRFELTELNGPLLANVCQQLDGIPLAIELAAARLDGLTLEQVAARLHQRFRLLTSGSRVALPRQQTLRATLDWSYDLLDDLEKRLLNRVAVFARGWTLEAAEAVCAGQGIEAHDVLDLLLRLVRKSLVVAEGDGRGAERYRLLETLRQYAQERLAVDGEQDLARNRHASYYLALVDKVEPSLWELAWLKRLLPEQDNLRAALRWFTDSKAIELAVRLGGRLWPMWLYSGYLTEGQAQLRALMALPVAMRGSPEWARLAMNAGLVEMFAGDFAAARARLEEAVALRRATNDPHLARTLCFLGLAAREQADYSAASLSFDESLALARQIDDRICIVHALSCQATISHATGDYALARTQYEQGLALAREWGDQVEAPWFLHNLGCLALDEGEYVEARDWLTQGVAARSEYDSLGFVHILAEFATLAAAEGLPTAALRLAGASSALTQRTGIVVQPHERHRYERWLATARQALGDEAAEAAWEEGRQMRLGQALTYAQDNHDVAAVTAPVFAQPVHDQPWDSLTPRQREVAALIASGHSNRRIGEALVITERTVAAHIEHILAKLGFASRTQIAVWASQHGLVVSSNP